MKIPFHKMHGAGNDFIVIDDRALSFPLNDALFIARICARHTGIGSDGILLLQPSDSADLRMRFINPDGKEAAMCGNGLRCFARLAHDLNAASSSMCIKTQAGLVRAEVLGNMIQVDIPSPSALAFDLPLGLENRVDFVNTGVPHAVMRVEELKDVNVQQFGSMLRYHDFFAPEGTNVNFILVERDTILSIRTYERGVEGETSSCGTGAAAAAFIAVRHGWIEWPVIVHCVGGHDLTIDFSEGKVTLTGGGVYVFKGTVEYGNRI